MTTQKLLISILLLISVLNINAQKNSFDGEFGSWHKKAIMTCGMIKSQSPDYETITGNLKEMENELKAITDKYLNNPPEEYAKDPNWRSYLIALTENLSAVKERAIRKQYPQAASFCAYFCSTVGKMHKINGITDLTDLMFSWRAELKNTTDMVSVGNTDGAAKNLAVVEELYRQVTAMKAKRNNSSLNELFLPLDEAYKTWLKTTKYGDATKLSQCLNKFTELFSKPYLTTI